MIPLDIWRELKTYLVHNIKTQSKHIKNEKNIINFNNTMRQVPRILPPPSGPKIIYTSRLKPHRFAKFIYHIQVFKPGRFGAGALYRDGKLTIISHCILPDDHHLYPMRDYNNHFVSCAVPFRRTSS
jgi:hypothetical protein